MFKISFKEEDNCPCKIVEKAGKVTTVIYKGTVRLPKIWWYLPKEIFEWIKHRDCLEIYENVANNTLIVYARGKARCADGDVYDSLKGERIAEAKAKKVIYKFFAGLCHRIYSYYEGIFVDVLGDRKKYSELCQVEKEHIDKLLENGDKQ